MASIEIKKPQYIRKYDFIRYFTRNKDEWFWPTKKIVEYIDNKAKQITEPEDDEDENNEKEFDSYEYKKENEDMDKDDPKIFEGNIIDRQSKEFIKLQFKDCKTIYDFDQLHLSNDDAFAKTKELLVSDNFILFQPTFIYKNKAVAKPDAFIKQNGKYILIETKGTTTTKLAHLIDLTFQHIVINDYLTQINASIDKYYLCLIDYRFGNKNELGFCLSEFASITKSGWGSKPAFGDKYSADWIEQRKINKTAKCMDIPYLDVICKYSSYVPESYPCNKKGKPDARWKKFTENYKQLRDEDKFDDIIDELSNHQIVSNPSLVPTSNYKCWFKDNEYWLNVREYYISDTKNDNHQLFSYSGKLTRFKDVYENFYLKHKTSQELFMSLKDLDKKAGQIYYWRVVNNQTVNEETKTSFNKLKHKKVYFDFESINLATRVVDSTLPFMQCVNQVSVIVDNGDGVTKNKPCNNLLFDPLEMDVEKYKQIVDAILPDKINLDLCTKYSYVVFNKSFEKTRLEEMNWLIGDEEYSKKIEVIISNLFDLAELFIIRNSSDNDEQTKGFVCLPELKGFYSIKKILPIVKSKLFSAYKDTGCVDYKTDLAVHNGNEAQTLATKRFFKIINDKEWANITNDLKKYCENDVRAMVAVEYFVKQLLKTKTI